jgi:hypothetical protein
MLAWKAEEKPNAGVPIAFVDDEDGGNGQRAGHHIRFVISTITRSARSVSGASNSDWHARANHDQDPLRTFTKLVLSQFEMVLAQRHDRARSMIEREKRVITRLPLEELWSGSADLGARCLGTISREEIAQLLRQGPVLFVVADVGHRPIWIDVDECYPFWKREVKTHLADPDHGIVLESYPDQYAYIARRWATELSHPVVVLEKHH